MVKFLNVGETLDFFSFSKLFVESRTYPVDVPVPVDAVVCPQQRLALGVVRDRLRNRNRKICHQLTQFSCVVYGNIFS